jgi:hypothetical protein
LEHGEWYAAKTLVLELLLKHDLPTNATDHYNVESGTRWISAMEQDLREFSSYATPIQN